MDDVDSEEAVDKSSQLEITGSKVIMEKASAIVRLSFIGTPSQKLT